MKRPTSRAFWALALAVVLLAVAPRVFAQQDGPAQEAASDLSPSNPLACLISMDRGFATDCGVDHLNNKYVFVGTILKSTKISAMEFRLELKPEESFLGAPPDKLEVVTSQGACMAAFVPGERWLFDVGRDDGDPSFYVAYMRGSEPEKDAQKQIAKLRRLAKMDNAGLLRGHVAREEVYRDRDDTLMSEDSDLPRHKVIATPEPSGTPITTFTDKEGDFEFEPLPPGDYEVSANTAPGLWAFEGALQLEAHECAWVSIELGPDGQISGRLTTPDGKPASTVQVYAVAISDNGVGSLSTWTGEDGRYAIHGLRPGRYLVGVEQVPEQVVSSDAPLKLKLYFPGVKDEDHAVAVDLGKAEKREDINFQIPKSLADKEAPETPGEPEAKLEP